MLFLWHHITLNSVDNNKWTLVVFNCSILPLLLTSLLLNKYNWHNFCQQGCYRQDRGYLWGAYAHKCNSAIKRHTSYTEFWWIIVLICTSTCTTLHIPHETWGVLKYCTAFLLFTIKACSYLRKHASGHVVIHTCTAWK